MSYRNFAQNNFVLFYGQNEGAKEEEVKEEGSKESNREEATVKHRG